MRKRSNHVVPAKTGGWAVRKSGSARVSRVFRTKDEAKRYGIRISRSEKTELYIHKMDGTIQNRNSFGNDPYPPRDKRR